jgi:antitoxin YefM
MNTINYSSLRENLGQIISDIIANRTPYEIVEGSQEPVVMVSKHDFDSMQETLYILSSSENARRLNESIAQANQGDLIGLENL